MSNRDLKGSTALMEGLDPEDARAIIDPALQVTMDAVHRYDGNPVLHPLYLATRVAYTSACPLQRRRDPP